MAGLQRSAQTFRRSGSSGLVWDERFLTEGVTGNVSAAGGDGARERREPELRHSRSVGSLLRRGDEKRATKHSKDQQKHQKEEEEVVVVVAGRKAFRARDVAPAAEPPSPRLPGCCGAGVRCAIFRGSGNGAGSASKLARGGSSNNKPRKR